MFLIPSLPILLMSLDRETYVEFKVQEFKVHMVQG